MDPHQRFRRFCRCMIGYALVLRLISSPLPQRLWERLRSDLPRPNQTETKTGQNVRFSASLEAFSDYFRESPPPQLPEVIQKPVFSADDAAGVELYYGCPLRPELDQLLTAPLQWDLADGAPAVLITHTHTTESYTRQQELYVETSDYRTLDENYNMIAIGALVADILEEEGIRVIHDRQIHDYPSYNGSYAHARKQISALLEENPSVRLVLDLHRDASGTPGTQLRTLANVAGQPSAQLMLVVGTGSGGLSHPDWQKNLSLALKLQVLLETQNPGLMRPLSLRSSRFNQDLSPGMLLVEVGAAGNTHSEAVTAARLLAEAIIAMSRGTQTAALPPG